jgi:DNA-binding PadR family transcriptional regulator
MDKTSIEPHIAAMVAPQSFLPLKPDVLYICLAIASRPMHGYAIIRDVEERSDGQVRLQTGAFYRTLRGMLEDGLIEECRAPADEVIDDPRRRYYRLSAFGISVTDAELSRLSALVRMARREISDSPRLA